MATMSARVLGASRGLIGALTALLVLYWAPPALAGMALPPGRVLAVLPAARANQELIDQGRATPATLPFARGTRVYDVSPNRELYTVRYYVREPGRLQGGAVGGWVMPAEQVRRLSIDQVRDRFALPQKPDHLVVVRIPVGTPLRTGEAGPIAGWGQGGGQQVLLLEYIPLSDYGLRAELPAQVGAAPYDQRVGSADAQRVGRYLDGLGVVSPYSYLEVTRLGLDYQDQAVLPQALNQLGPRRYDVWSWLGLRDSLLFTDALRRRMARPGQEDLDRETDLWARGYGALGRRDARGDRLGHDFGLVGLAAGLDRDLGGGLLGGAALGASRARADFDHGLGSASLDGLNLGVYGAWRGGPWFLGLTLTGGLDDVSLERAVSFGFIGQEPRGVGRGWRVAGGLEAGCRLMGAGWVLRPSLSLDLVHGHFDRVEEGGGDLALTLDDFAATTLVGRLGLGLVRDFSLGREGLIAPELGLYWLHYQPLDDRELTAGLAGQPGGFSVHGDGDPINALVPVVGLTLAWPQAARLSLRYQGEIAETLQVHQILAGFSLSF